MMSVITERQIYLQNQTVILENHFIFGPKLCQPNDINFKFTRFTLLIESYFQERIITLVYLYCIYNQARSILGSKFHLSVSRKRSRFRTLFIWTFYLVCQVVIHISLTPCTSLSLHCNILGIDMIILLVLSSFDWNIVLMHPHCGCSCGHPILVECTLQYFSLILRNAIHPTKFVHCQDHNKILSQQLQSPRIPAFDI